MRAQKQIPALPRLSRYMNRNYKLDKDTTQRLLDLAVEDNLVKLHKKVDLEFKNLVMLVIFIKHCPNWNIDYAGWDKRQQGRSRGRCLQTTHRY